MLFWRNRNFNEKFDGIIYAVSVSLGFAAIENIFYVFNNNSMQVGLMRAFTAVPGHTIFGIIMGFYLGLAKFNPSQSKKWLLRAFMVPWLFHGVYDFLVLSGHYLLLLAFLPFLVYMYRVGLRRMKELNAESQFNPMNIPIQLENPSNPTDTPQNNRYE
jgi:RsiW-degrading membrane proteinase PrsW (M82 family)